MSLIHAYIVVVLLGVILGLYFCMFIVEVVRVFFKIILFVWGEVHVLLERR